MQYRNYCAFCCGLLLLVSGVAISANATGQTASRASEQADVATSAAQVLHNEMNQPADMRIPQNLLNASRCIAVVPSSLKIGLIVGGSHGNGVVSCRTQSSAWSAPIFFGLTSGSLGAQAGVKTSQFVFLFLDHNSVNQLLSGNFEFGADVDVTAGTLGAQRDVSSRPADVVVYEQKSKGLFAGAEIGGAKYSVDQEANQNVYGKNVNPSDVLQGRLANVNYLSQIKVYPEALQMLAPASQEKELGK